MVWQVDVDGARSSSLLPHLFAIADRIFTHNQGIRAISSLIPFEESTGAEAAQGDAVGDESRAYADKLAGSVCEMGEVEEKDRQGIFGLGSSQWVVLIRHCLCL